MGTPTGSPAARKETDEIGDGAGEAGLAVLGGEEEGDLDVMQLGAVFAKDCSGKCAAGTEAQVHLMRVAGLGERATGEGGQSAEGGLQAPRTQGEILDREGTVGAADVLSDGSGAASGFEGESDVGVGGGLIGGIEDDAGQLGDT
jgi:hypothetical protein